MVNQEEEALAVVVDGGLQSALVVEHLEVPLLTVLVAGLLLPFPLGHFSQGGHREVELDSRSMEIGTAIFYLWLF